MGKWYNEAVFYHMYPIGMTGAPRQNNIEKVEHRFLQLEEWLDHLETLGITAIYIGPLFESTSHGYDTKDYKLVDRRLGDNEDFKRFVKKAHSKNIRIVVDGVFNHTGREFFAFEDIKKNKQNSPYCSWYKGISFDWNSPYNDGFGYEAWRNCFELVNLNYWEPAVRQYILEVIRYWIQEFDIDGIRLDCADCLEKSFLEEMRSCTEQAKEDFWLMGEVIHGDYSMYISDTRLHSVTDYELHKGLYSGHNDHNYFEIAHTIRRLFDENGGICRGMHLYSFVDNHDVDRIASKLQNPEHIFPIFTLLYTLPGIPSVYYGSEWGIQGKKEGPNDDFLRPAVDIQQVMAKEIEGNWKLMDWVTTLGKIHKKYPVLANGRYRELLLTNRQYAFARFDDNQAVMVAVNNDEQPAELWIPLVLKDKKMTDLVTGEEVQAEFDQIHLTIEANASIIISLE